MDKLFFRPNAKLESLFTDTPNEGISIGDDEISDCTVDYHGQDLLSKATYLPTVGNDVSWIKLYIMSLDGEGRYIDTNPKDVSWESLCNWLEAALRDRGWIEMVPSEGLSSGGAEIFFLPKTEREE